MARRAKSDLDLWLSHHLDIATRTIYIGDPDEGDIGPKTASDVLKALHILNGSFNPEKPINVVLNSSGGSVFDGLAIHDAIEACQCEVNIHVLGQCCSIAVAILQAGDHRSASPNSWLMIHDGDAEDGKIAVGDLEALMTITEAQREQYYCILAEKSKLSTKEIRELCRRDYWMTATEAEALGLIDGVR